MSDWVSAVIGAGSAVVGGIATGCFTRNAATASLLGQKPQDGHSRTR